MAEPEWDRLARAHQRRQITEAARIQAALARLWEQTIDPHDLTRSFLVFRERAVPLIMSGRSMSKVDAQRYFEAVHNLSGLSADLAAVYEVGWTPGNAKSSLSAASGKSLARADALQRAGAPSAAAIEMAKRQMLASAKRQMLNAGRQRVLRLTRTSGYGRWARVSDGSPCAFCMMLVSRGPVYTAASVHFQAHDGCGCSARPVLKGETGWSPQARAFRDEWSAAGSTLQELRQVIDRRRRAAGLDLAA